MPFTLTVSIALSLILSAGCGSTRIGPGRLSRLPVQIVVASPGPKVGIETGPKADLRAVSSLARRYYRALDDLRRRMQTAPLAALITAGCPCQSQIRAIRAAIRRGERYTDQVRLLTVVPHLDRPDLADVVVSIDVRQAGLVDADGRRIGVPMTAHDVHRELMCHRISGHWLIERVVAV